MAAEPPVCLESGLRMGRCLAIRTDGAHTPRAGGFKKVTDKQWHHVAFVKNGSTLRNYVDWVQDTSFTDTTTSWASGGGILLSESAIRKRKQCGQGSDRRRAVYYRGLSGTEVARLAGVLKRQNTYGLALISQKEKNGAVHLLLQVPDR